MYNVKASDARGRTPDSTSASVATASVGSECGRKTPAELGALVRYDDDDGRLKVVVLLQSAALHLFLARTRRGVIKYINTTQDLWQRSTTRLHFDIQ